MTSTGDFLALISLLLPLVGLLSLRESVESEDDDEEWLLDMLSAITVVNAKVLLLIVIILSIITINNSNILSDLFLAAVLLRCVIEPVNLSI